MEKAMFLTSIGNTGKWTEGKNHEYIYFLSKSQSMKE